LDCVRNAIQWIITLFISFSKPRNTHVLQCAVTRIKAVKLYSIHFKITFCSKNYKWRVQVFTTIIRINSRVYFDNTRKGFILVPKLYFNAIDNRYRYKFRYEETFFLRMSPNRASVASFLVATSHTFVTEATTYTTHNKHTRRTSMPSAGLESGIPAIERLQTNALGRSGTEIGGNLC